MFKSAFWAMAAFTIIASLWPIPQQAPGFLAYDKLLHMLGYTVLTLLGLLAYRDRNWSIVAFAVALGVLIEVVQPYTGRFFSGADMLANTIGALLGRYLAPNIRRLLQ